MKTIRLTTAQALVKFLVAQRIVINGREEKLFPGVMAIFGHGNVTSLGVALDEERKNIRTWRGQNEQGMALAAVVSAVMRFVTRLILLLFYSRAPVICGRRHSVSL